MHRAAVWKKLGTLVFWLIWPLTTPLLRRTTRTRLLLSVGDEVLVTRSWVSDGRWSLPGGGLHRGEIALQGVLREVHEEVGIDLLASTVRAVGSGSYHGHGQTFSCHYFVAELTAKPMLHLQRLEISAAQWVPLNQLRLAGYGSDVVTAQDLRQRSL